MGVNAKESDTAIGFFGTGMKYAIATVLRYGGKITLYRGLQKYEFTSRIEKIRGKSFGLIHMNDQPMAITTDLGKNWQMWMAMRELYSNMLDEGGKAYSSQVLPKENTTTIHVEGKAFFDEFLTREKIFLHERQPLVESEYFKVYEGESTHAYYRGIRVNKLNRPSVFTYSMITSTELSEDRIIANSYLFDHELVHFLVTECKDKELLYKVIGCATDTKYEYHIDFALGYSPSELFLDVVETLPKARVNRTAWRLWLLSKRGRDVPEYEETKLDPMDEQRLTKAKALLRATLCFDDSFVIRVAVDLGNNSQGEILGRAEKNQIWLSRRVFEQGTKQVASTLYEEWVHLKFGHPDRSYRMQSFLFDQIMTLAERLNGEAL